MDYGRYLNTLPRAPVVYGIRGFPVFATLRYGVFLLTVAASVGYKFGLAEGSADIYEAVDAGLIVPSVQQYAGGKAELGADMPWFQDRIPSGRATCFYHHMRSLTAGPPTRFMSGSVCRVDFVPEGRDSASGRLISREVVMLAQKSEDEGNFTMSQDNGWIEVRSSSRAGWHGVPEGDRVVVQYRSSSRGEVQVQWGKLGPGYINGSSEQSEPVAKREPYKMHYAVAEVERQFRGPGFTDWSDSDRCLFLRTFPSMPIRVLSVDDSSNHLNDLAVLNSSTTNAAMERIQPWLDALVSDEDTIANTGVSVVVRVFMSVKATEDMNARRASLRRLDADDQSFGLEDISKAARPPNFPYLYFIGYRDELHNVAGCYRTVVTTFIIMGVLAILTMILRLVVGPAKVTLWEGQHLYSVRVGAISIPDGRESGLVSGYRAAPENLGRVKIDDQLFQEERRPQESQSPVSASLVSV